MNETFQYMDKNDLLSLLEVIDRALLVGDDLEFQALLQHVGTLLPVEHLICVLSHAKPGHLPQEVMKIINVSYPDAWMRRYLEQNYMEVDPILRRHFKCFETQTWTHTYQRVKSKAGKAFIEEAREHGLTDGITLGLFSPASSTGSLFSFEGRALTQNPRHIVVLEYLLPHLHSALARADLAVPKPDAVLSEREKEILQWVKTGKTNWEISMILRISERTVKFHIHNAMAKLGASTRSHAVALALRQGLIEL